MYEEFSCVGKYVSSKISETETTHLILQNEILVQWVLLSIPNVNINQSPSRSEIFAGTWVYKSINSCESASSAAITAPPSPMASYKMQSAVCVAPRIVHYNAYSVITLC